MNKKLIFPYFLREFLSLAGMGVALFWTAGRIDWWPAWGSLFVMIAWMVATAVIIFRYNPGLLAERMGTRKGSQSLDALIVSVMGLTTLARYIVAGLDERNGWSGEFSPAVQWTGFALCLAGYALFTWATASNAFFSQVVRLQTEREHRVVNTGPYHFVRHPAYLGASVYELAVAFLYGSWWALLVGVLDVVLLVIRTRLEDNLLQKELAGYSAYAMQVRYRLLPGIW
jgi:protein-S-isoprenylcysteine O-methyltransferase Ste14